jgi:hypothetical protein
MRFMMGAIAFGLVSSVWAAIDWLLGGLNPANYYWTVGCAAAAGAWVTYRKSAPNSNDEAAA